MAKVGVPSKPTAPDPATEEVVDYMADAPPERPYAEAVSPQHRALLEAAGLPVEEATPAS